MAELLLMISFYTARQGFKTGFRKVSHPYRHPSSCRGSYPGRIRLLHSTSSGNNKLCLGIGSGARLSPIPLLTEALTGRQSEHGDAHTYRKRKFQPKLATETESVGCLSVFVTE